MKTEEHAHTFQWVAIFWLATSSCMTCTGTDDGRRKIDELESQNRQLRWRVDVLESDQTSANKRMDNLYLKNRELDQKLYEFQFREYQKSLR